MFECQIRKPFTKPRIVIFVRNRLPGLYNSTTDLNPLCLDMGIDLPDGSPNCLVDSDTCLSPGLIDLEKTPVQRIALIIPDHLAKHKTLTDIFEEEPVALFRLTHLFFSLFTFNKFLDDAILLIT